MIRPSLRFKYLRCLILCVGFVTTPASVMAQIADLQSNEGANRLDSSLNPVKVKEISQSDHTLAKNRELTFQFLDATDTDSTIAAKTNSENDTVVPGGNSDGQKISKNKKNKKLSNKKSKKKSKKFSNKKSKKFSNKKSKKFKKGKKFKKYCGLFFEGKVSKGSEFTAAGNFSSSTLIQVFDNEAAYLSGSSAIQTIEYSSTSEKTVAVNDQIGSMTIKKTQTGKLTFQYLSTTDTDYTDVVVANTEGYGAVTGAVDADGESYVIVSDGRRGKKCKKFKRVRKCKKGSNLFIQGNMTNGGKFIESVDCSSDKLVQIFNDAPEYIFLDVSKSYWASRFIYRLSSLQIVQGFPDKAFQPETAITHAQFAAIISRAFNVRRVTQTTVVSSISRDYWAYGDLQTAYSMGFIDITRNNFNVEQRLTKLTVLTSIAKGLGYTQITSDRSIDDILSVFSDARSIPESDRVYIAALVEKGILVNYPNVNTLNINQVISRAETCSLVHQALVSLGQLESISSEYITQ